MDVERQFSVPVLELGERGAERSGRGGVRGDVPVGWQLERRSLLRNQGVRLQEA